MDRAGFPRQSARLRRVADVADYVGSQCFRTGPPGTVGVEVEWLTIDVREPHRRVHPQRCQAALADIPELPGGSRISYEPGGQLELSSLPWPDLGGCVQALDRDIAAVVSVLARKGIGLVGLGADPIRPPDRVLDTPRYTAMEAYFALNGAAGRIMMCCTASTQVNVEAGPESEWRRRWELAHVLGPMLVAAFANSPMLGGRVTGWRSTRQAIWAVLGPARIQPARPLGQRDPVAAWTSYALSARMMLRRQRDGGYRPVLDGSTFADWLGGPLRRSRPGIDDLALHLTTLFPPIRPRGWLEFRMIDAQPAAYWAVPAAVVTALLDDPQAGELAHAVCEPVAGEWLAAARDGLAHPGLAIAAARCLDLTLQALPRLGNSVVTNAVQSFAEQYTWVGRCPADDLIGPSDAKGPPLTRRDDLREVMLLP
ncbi:MAG: ergothioneine biosynthesis glutamate--cysteine ligase EgtA [Pseudonocardiales bacterium]|nr:ergothioneine biosynthesis glutamate--cysteine ligase EgtA [Pseudonocardiales bacterium]